MLTGLEVRDLPIPLGGTSNHFRTSALRELGGWDPYNVTEDADLGIRASARAPCRRRRLDHDGGGHEPRRHLHRSAQPMDQGLHADRAVHARHPRALLQQIGWRRFASFALLIAGTPLTFLGVIPSRPS
jgi:hypothetical protein